MPTAVYRRRSPEDSVLYQAVQQNLAGFVEHAQMSGRDIPGFVQRRLERFLSCGILAKGFARFVCHSCQHQRLVPLSCKVRGLCPSCGGRRMAEAAAHLVEHVFPEAPVRQWVLSIPIRLRYILAYDAGLCGRVLNSFLTEVFRWYRWKSKAELGLDSVSQARCGSVTFIQRADSGLKLNVHFHALLVDGVFVHDRGPMHPPQFFALSAPSDEEILRVAIKIRKKVLRILEHAGHSLGDAEAFDEFAEREPVLAQLCAASLTNKVLVGHQAGQPVMKLRGPPKSTLTLTLTGRRCANVDGFSLHANTKVEASDRKGLEKLCRYVARPPVSSQRLRWLGDGKIAYDLKRTWSDGTRAVVFEPLDFIGKLMPLLPPARVNQVRYHGVLAPAAAWRDHIVPKSPTPKGQQCKKRRNYSWAELMARVFEFDVLACPKCDGRMRWVATIMDRETIRVLLRASGLSSDSPPPDPSLGLSDRKLVA